MALGDNALAVSIRRASPGWWTGRVMAGAQTEARKREHLAAFRRGDIRARSATTWLECVHLVHQALPELHADQVDTTTTFAGHALRAPILVTGMTGGTPEARDINRGIAAVAERMGLGFGLGSQRAMIEDPSLTWSYEVRDVAPSVFLTGNIGGTQLAATPLERVREALDRVGADALCVHLNPAQEMAQGEGDRDFRGVADAIRAAVLGLGLPVIVKEVGAGLSREVAHRLLTLGVRHLDVAGVGGTSWVGVEATRAHGSADCAFWDWGLPTAAAVAETADLGLQVVASGGIRSGLDVARAIALGATLAGVASPVLRAWFDGGERAVESLLSRMVEGLRTAMVLTGSRTLSDLRAAPRVVLPPLLEWMRQRCGK